ncbi:MAG: FKBP-type peptidyl-prolyl cis-trans isomerase [Verrucomicrobiales bacterium]|jgi:FKBP-type peptidyl-prolyl cis-trans isomerase|nr:FKBP-type peptidyl-prolyl cis-trans isomerase [Verrucomicrobiales bacterium]
MKFISLLTIMCLPLTVSLAQDTNKAIANTVNEVRFLEQNKQREGVKATKSGLQYEVVKEGAGESPKPNHTVTVHYEGKLIDGTVFDSSYRRGAPATFGVTQVIAGWTEGLQLMKPGATYLFYIPAKLAYGARGAGDKIGPNECLIFKVELLSVR